MKTITQSELNRLCQQLHDLREALKPFAEFSKSLPDVDPARPRLTDSGPWQNIYVGQVNYTITCADLRNARVLLERCEKEDEDAQASRTEFAALSRECDVCGTLFMPSEGDYDCCSEGCAVQKALPTRRDRGGS